MVKTFNIICLVFTALLPLANCVASEQLYARATSRFQLESERLGVDYAADVFLDRSSGAFRLLIHRSDGQNSAEVLSKSFEVGQELVRGVKIIILPGLGSVFCLEWQDGNRVTCIAIYSVRGDGNIFEVFTERGVGTYKFLDLDIGPCFIMFDRDERYNENIARVYAIDGVSFKQITRLHQSRPFTFMISNIHH